MAAASARKTAAPDAPAAAGEAIDPAAARDLIAPLYLGRTLHSGEAFAAHAEGMAAILRTLRDDADLLAAAYLFGTHDVLRDADEWLRARFGPQVAQLVADLRQMTRVAERTRARADTAGSDDESQHEALRRMLVAMSNDPRVVLLRLASRLQTLRWAAATRADDVHSYARETLALYAPLASRLGIWQVKWELEDLSFRFIEPQTYQAIARGLDEKRAGREAFIEQAIATLAQRLADAGVAAQVSGRPKHLYSIWRKMQSKGVDLDGLYDVRGLRVIVAEVAHCYQALSIVHALWTPIASEYDDYIARPKDNGYQSLHTVVRDPQDRPLEIQIRTQRMHDFAELGVAAHWRYKEGGSARGAPANDERISWLRRLLAWRQEVEPVHPDRAAEERIYLLTPQARVVELPAGSTPVDFAYHVHTELGHRCRGARVDGAMVPLGTRLHTGQTVEIIAARSGGPSRDWLNPELGFLASARSRAKARQWFNAMELAQSAAAGREIVERELARLGRTATKLDDLARRLGFAAPEELFVAATKEEFSLRSIEQVFAAPTADTDAAPGLLAGKPRMAPGGRGQVLVVGVDALLTSLARCCRPAPPDEIVGFVTRGKGVSIHRAVCANAQALGRRQGERLIDVAWGGAADAVYPIDAFVVAQDRPGLLRDISEVFAREKLNVVGVHTESQRGQAQMQFTVEVGDRAVLRRALAQIAEVPGVVSARRR